MKRVSLYVIAFWMLVFLFACSGNNTMDPYVVNSSTSLRQPEDKSTTDSKQNATAIPDIKHIAIEKIEYIDKSMGEDVVFTDSFEIEKISMVLSKAEIHNIITTDEPEDSNLGSCYLLKCYELKSDDEPSYTIYLDPFFIETQEQIFGPYKIDNLKEVLKEIISTVLELRE